MGPVSLLSLSESVCSCPSPPTAEGICPPIPLPSSVAERRLTRLPSHSRPLPLNWFPFSTSVPQRGETGELGRYAAVQPVPLQPQRHDPAFIRVTRSYCSHSPRHTTALARKGRTRAVAASEIGASSQGHWWPCREPPEHCSPRSGMLVISCWLQSMAAADGNTAGIGSSSQHGWRRRRGMGAQSPRRPTPKANLQSYNSSSHPPCADPDCAGYEKDHRS